MSCFWRSDLVRFGFPLMRENKAITVTVDKSSNHIRPTHAILLVGTPNPREYLMYRKEMNRWSLQGPCLTVYL
jgi:hypothetical protein